MAIDSVIDIATDNYFLFLVPRKLQKEKKEALFLPGGLIYDSLLNSKWINEDGSYKSLNNKNGISGSIMPLNDKYMIHIYSKNSDIEDFD